MMVCKCFLCRQNKRYKRLEHKMSPAVRRLYDDLWTWSANKITDLEMELFRKKEARRDSI
jgi:hypothetical protein